MWLFHFRHRQTLKLKRFYLILYGRKRACSRMEIVGHMALVQLLGVTRGGPNGFRVLVTLISLVFLTIFRFIDLFECFRRHGVLQMSWSSATTTDLLLRSHRRGVCQQTHSCWAYRGTYFFTKKSTVSYLIWMLYLATSCSYT